MKSALFALALLVYPIAPALAQEAEPAAAEAVAAPAVTRSTTLREGDTAPDGTKVKCRKMAVMGTRFPKRECKSEAAWKAFDTFTAEEARSATDRFQRDNVNGGSGG